MVQLKKKRSLVLKKKRSLILKTVMYSIMEAETALRYRFINFIHKKQAGSWVVSTAHMEKALTCAYKTDRGSQFFLWSLALFIRDLFPPWKWEIYPCRKREESIEDWNEVENSRKKLVEFVRFTGGKQIKAESWICRCWFDP